MPRAMACVGQGEKADRSAPTRPPLSCRTSPPQGGRSAASPPACSFHALQLEIGEAVDDSAISPLEGEMSGRTEGGRERKLPACQRPQLSLRQIPCMGVAALFGNHPERSDGNVARRIRIDLCQHLRVSAVAGDRYAPTRCRCSARTAFSRTSAVNASIVSCPPPSTTTDTFGPSRGVSPASSTATRIRSASGRGSAISWGSMPASGPVSTGMPVRTAMPSASTSVARSRALSAVRPRICKLPRAVTSMMPLPCRRADSASPINDFGDNPPATGLSRTSRPSPVCMGAAKAGQAPRREKAFMLPPQAPRPRQSARPDRRRWNCARDARGRAGAPTGSARQ